MFYSSFQMEKALANMALKTAETPLSKEEQTPGPKEVASPAATPSAANSSLKGVSQSLLERVSTWQGESAGEKGIKLELIRGDSHKCHPTPSEFHRVKR